VGIAGRTDEAHDDAIGVVMLFQRLPGISLQEPDGGQPGTLRRDGRGDPGRVLHHVHGILNRMADRAVPVPQHLGDAGLVDLDARVPGGHNRITIFSLAAFRAFFAARVTRSSASHRRQRQP
jgi:hypothetical protein